MLSGISGLVIPPRFVPERGQLVGVEPVPIGFDPAAGTADAVAGDFLSRRGKGLHDGVSSAEGARFQFRHFLTLLYLAYHKIHG